MPNFITNNFDMPSRYGRLASPLNKRFAMLRLPCSALRILKRLQHNK
ncbi:MAG: hypothetical protein LBH59_01715 [Planctomycetaceae bacterium]|nr:hypothetical protein [Planctomycetaceae bacterium]